jgi:thiol-disulfide isomerase/thioredoxin
LSVHRALWWLTSLALLAACQSKKSDQPVANTKSATLQQGVWRAVIEMNEQQLPFNFRVEYEGTQPVLFLLNAEEEIRLDELIFRGDSIVVPMHIFNTELVARIENEGAWQGYWVKKDYPDYRLPFRANAGEKHRFSEAAAPPVTEVSGTYAVTFKSGSGEGPDEAAIGIFKQQGSRVTGTFLTPLGDYRYLEGEMNGSQLRLSCFDGEHAFLFTAKADPKTQALTEGGFWSGRSWFQPWSGQPDPAAALPHPDSLTFLKPGYETLSFQFPNLDSTLVSLDDERYRGKVVLVQLMGSWCPNCMDETKFLADFYQKNHDRGLEIIALAYERNPEFEKAKGRLERLKEKIGIDYELLLTGVDNDKENTAASLPMLNQVLAYPTTIFVDRQGKVRRIHTGFSGPGTGVYYEEFVQKFTLFVDKLLAEPALPEGA